MQRQGKHAEKPHHSCEVQDTNNNGLPQLLLAEIDVEDTAVDA
jgi:hypothetical protein